MQPSIESVKDKSTLKLTTIGRKTGLKRVTTIWFGILDGRLYVSSGRGEQSDWVRNIKNNAHIDFTIGEVRGQGIAAIIQDPNIKQRLRKLYWKKYHMLMVFAEVGKILMRIPLSASIPVLVDWNS
ncbi:MAG TPA: nitroreductase/quinone reductase family protein [Candidatus Bathyarchaeia archaeon]|nr:nitroreductase/quinone reductase family protein [Candidatus Bathyarchaeia archaeon]HKM77905.1 nitroreductase/quinone reductase family protein [Candidatus Bathyarchaeia archaeon]